MNILGSPNNNLFSFENEVNCILDKKPDKTPSINIELANYAKKITTRHITFKKIENPIFIENADIFIKNIEFQDGTFGNINYGENEVFLPNLKLDNFMLTIPCYITSFIVKIQVENKNEKCLIHWLVDLKIKQLLPLSFVKDNKNPKICSKYSNTSGFVIEECVPKNIYRYIERDESNLLNIFNKKDNYISPFTIYLFTANEN